MRNFDSVDELWEASKKIDDTIKSLQDIREIFNKNRKAMGEFYKDSKLTDKDLEVRYAKNISADTFEKVMHSGLYKVYPETYDIGDVILTYMIGVSKRYPYRILTKRKGFLSDVNMHCLGLKPLDFVTCKNLDEFVEENMRSSLLYSWGMFSIFAKYENSLMSSELAENLWDKVDPAYLNNGFSYWLDCKETNDNGERLYSWIADGKINYGTAEKLRDTKFAVLPFSYITVYDPED